MRGRTDSQGEMFYVMDVEGLVPADHPLRAIKPKVDSELRRLRPHFNQAYARGGRPSIPPEQLIKATLLQALYSIRSERRLAEEIRYNLLYRWFLDLKPDAAVWDHSTFTKNRARWREQSEGYRASQRSRRRVEEIFGWLKTIAGMRKARCVGRWKIQEYAYAAAFNFIRLAKIEAG